MWLQGLQPTRVLSLSMGFSRQEYWNGLPCPPPGDLPNPGTEPASSVSPALAGGFFTTVPPGKLQYGPFTSAANTQFCCCNMKAASNKCTQVDMAVFQRLLFTQTGSQPLGPCQPLPCSMELLVIFLPSRRKSPAEYWANREENKRLSDVLLRLAPESLGSWIQPCLKPS